MITCATSNGFSESDASGRARKNVPRVQSFVDIYKCGIPVLVRTALLKSVLGSACGRYGWSLETRDLEDKNSLSDTKKGLQ